MRKKYDFKKVDITLSPKCIPESYFDIVTTASFQTLAEKSPGTKICG